MVCLKCARSWLNLSANNRTGLDYDVQSYVNDVDQCRHAVKYSELPPCFLCKAPPIEPWSTLCGHIYCEACLNKIEEDAVLRHENRAKCRECSSEISYKFPLPEGNKDGCSSSWISEAKNILPSAKTLAIKAQVVNELARISTSDVLKKLTTLPFR